jgi:formylglycine-generating enzyme required for sulfatase activity
MVFVEGGTFTMDSAPFSRGDKEAQQVTVDSFYISKYELTQAEWVDIMWFNPSYSSQRAAKLPIYVVTWYAVIDYCNKRSIKEGLVPVYSGSGDNITANPSANGYRLPTDAEWEYAARGGNKSQQYEYAGSNNLDEVGWYSKKEFADTNIHAVGRKAPNELGLYDMSGNVAEWVWDCDNDDYIIDDCVTRGGMSIYDNVSYFRINSRSYDGRFEDSYIGFRVVRNAN